MKKKFLGTMLDRFNGIDFSIGRIVDSVLDIGCSNGLILYEFMRQGASHLYGIDSCEENIIFARNLFEYFPIISRFLCCDISQGLSLFEKDYNLVLYLGIHHHLRNQHGIHEAEKILERALDKCAEVFMIRSPFEILKSVRGIIESKGFYLKQHINSNNISPLEVYHKTTDNIYFLS